MAYSTKIKNEVKERLNRGEKAKIIAEQMGISLATIYNWKKEIKKLKEAKEESQEQDKKEEKEESDQKQKLISTEEGEETKTTGIFAPIEETDKIDFRKELQVKTEGINHFIQSEKAKKHKNHFNEINQYLMEKRRTIYVKMQSTDFQTQREGISQWDKMEALIEKVTENKENKEVLNHLYEKILQLKEKEKGNER